MRRFACWALSLSLSFLFGSTGDAAAQEAPSWASDPRALMEQGRAAMAEGNSTGAEERLRLAIDNGLARGELVVVVESRWWLATVLERLGRSPEARRLLEGIAIDPLSPAEVRRRARARLRARSAPTRSTPAADVDSAWVVFGVFVGVVALTLTIGVSLYGAGGCDSAPRVADTCDAAVGFLVGGAIGLVVPFALAIAIQGMRQAGRLLTAELVTREPALLRF